MNNGAQLRVCAYAVQFIDGSEQEIKGTSLTYGMGFIVLHNGPNTVAVLSLHNVMVVRPVYQEAHTA
jgi:hypothetical protein